MHRFRFAFTVPFLLASALSAQGTAIGFSETFALARDRQKAIEQLIPGSKEFYYYQCLHWQNSGQLDKVPALVATWVQRHGRSDLVTEIENRQALLDYERDPQRTFAWLRERLGLGFDAQRASADSRRALPTRVEPSAIAVDKFVAKVLPDLSRAGLELGENAFAALATTPLTDDQLRSLLDVEGFLASPDLVSLVARELASSKSVGFGKLTAHFKLTRAQLDELAQSRTSLLDDDNFVTRYLATLQPSEDRDWRADPALREAYLVTLQAFVDRLPPSQNSLKAHVLYHRLLHDRATGRLDKERLLAYLRLPRRNGYENPEHMKRLAPGELASLTRGFDTGFARVGDDEPLVRDCLAHFLVDLDTPELFAPWVEGKWLRRLFAETKILAGKGDMERWYSLLDDAPYYARLAGRVELAFAPTTKVRFGSEDPVTLDLEVKNVEALTVKVFVVDAAAYARDTGHEVDANLDLDGIVPNEERRELYTESPLRRVRRHFEFPKLVAPGTYVIDFLGNGIVSRALIHKGSLRAVQRATSAGQRLTVVDERGRRVPEAGVWCAGVRFTTDARGEVTIPFASQAGRVQLVLCRGMQASMQWIEHEAESYALAAHLLTSREALIAGGKATLVVRPSLTVAGAPIDIRLLEHPVLTIRATDLDGVVAATTVRDLKLTNDADLVHEISVPGRLRKLELALQGSVPSLSLGKPIELMSTTTTLECNGNDATPKTMSALLGRGPDGWFLEVRGKAGEPRSELPLTLGFARRGFGNAIVTVEVATDGAGRVALGTLEGIYGMRCPTLDAEWPLESLRRSSFRSLHGSAGSVLRVAYHGTATRAERAIVGLHEGTIVDDGPFLTNPKRDAFEAVSIANGYVELRGLTPGDYVLRLAETGEHFAVRITSGPVESGWALGPDRALELADHEAMQVVEAVTSAESVRLRVANATKTTRVHVFTTRYDEPFDPLDGQTTTLGRGLRQDELATHESTYSAERKLSDEARYVLDRSYAKQLQGNLLRRPSLLLDPWNVHENASNAAVGYGSGKAGHSSPGKAGGGKKSKGGKKGGDARWTPGHDGELANLDFLGSSTPLLCNLALDAQGELTIPRARLGTGQLVHVVVVDGRDALAKTLVLREQPLVPVSTALKDGLPADSHFTEQRGIEFVDTGAQVRFENAGAAKLTTYGSLAQLFQLFQTLSGNQELERFAFLTRWPSLTIEEKQAAFSQHSCHEVHYFLYRKDRAFFDRVVRPYLANKAEKTFFDHYLLDADLTPYREPWAFDRLNVVEQILLTQKLAAAVRDAGVRRVRESFERLPIDHDREARLFSGVLNATALAPEAIYAGIAGKEPGAAVVDLNRVEEKPVEAKREDALAPAGFDVFTVERAQMRQLYRAPDQTQTLAESQYWKVLNAAPGLVSLTAFWRDFALAPTDRPFGSPHVATATRCVTEMLLALAVTDLPFTASTPTLAREGTRTTLTATAPLLCVHQELRTAEAAKQDAPVLLSQNLYRLDERFRFEGQEKLDAFVTGELVAGIAYGCQVVVTNPTSTPRRFDLLLQIPHGAVPVNASFPTRGMPVQLEPYATKAIDYAFYFPLAGDFAHFPAHVAKDGVLVTSAPSRTLHVVTTPTVVDTASWAHVAQNGTTDDVLAWLDAHNLGRADFAAVAWRLREKAFFTALVERLRTRLHYVDLVWSHGVLHGDEATTREYLAHHEAFVAKCGPVLASRLLTIEPFARGSHRHLEFDPMIHARAHRFGAAREIQDPEFAQQYSEFCTVLAHMPTLQDAELARVTYYLLLQDRVEEALTTFARIDPKKLVTRLQYDYLRCYLDFFTDEHAAARGIAESYRDHPIAHWRARFRDVLNQLDEAEGKAAAVSNPADRTQVQTQLAATEPALELVASGSQVVLRWKNLAKVQVLYHRLDIESAFSSAPFVMESSPTFAYVQAQRTDVLELPPGKETLTLDLPAEFAKGNALVEVRGAGIVRRATCLASSLAVQTIESYGQLQVTHAPTGKPAAKVYVKVYARSRGGAVHFHKDGYTDLRGRFDYASVSEQPPGDLDRFAVLVLDAAAGALVREVAPPGR